MKQINLKIFFIATILILFILIIVGKIILNKNKEVELVNNNKTQIILKTPVFKDRAVLKYENSIVIGDNLAELENGFFDLNIILKDKDKGIVEIYINKLWYRKFEKDYIDNLYLREIVKALSYSITLENVKNADQTTNLKLYEENLYQYIYEEYTSLRKNENNFKEITIGDKLFKSENVEGMLKITIEFKK